MVKKKQNFQIIFDSSTNSVQVFEIDRRIYRDVVRYYRYTSKVSIGTYRSIRVYFGIDLLLCNIIYTDSIFYLNRTKSRYTYRIESTYHHLSKNVTYHMISNISLINKFSVHNLNYVSLSSKLSFVLLYFY